MKVIISCTSEIINVLGGDYIWSIDFCDKNVSNFDFDGIKWKLYLRNKWINQAKKKTNERKEIVNIIWGLISIEPHYIIYQEEPIYG